MSAGVVPAAALAALRQLDDSAVWTLLLDARSGRVPVRADLTQGLGPYIYMYALFVKSDDFLVPNYLLQWM